MNGKRFSVSQCRLGLVYSYCNQHYERYARLVIDAFASRIIGLYIPWHAYFNNMPIPAIRTLCWRSKTMFSIIQCPNSVMSRVHAWLLPTIDNIILLGHWIKIQLHDVEVDQRKEAQCLRSVPPEVPPVAIKPCRAAQIRHRPFRLVATM